MESSATCKVCNYDDEGFLHLFYIAKNWRILMGNVKV